MARRRVRPGGRVLGVDILPQRPPAGVSSVQGNFLSKRLQQEIIEYLSVPDNGRMVREIYDDGDDDTEAKEDPDYGLGSGEIVRLPGYLEMERSLVKEEVQHGHDLPGSEGVADTILSDMSLPWPIYEPWSRPHLLTAWIRLQNVTGIVAKDHGSSMDLCDAALLFCINALKPSGSFVCKYYAGNEDRGMETRIRRVFQKVIRVKPKASRKESKEAYFVGLGKRTNVKEEEVFV